MFADFKKTVINDSTSSIPKEILDAYNSKIPAVANVKYIDNHDGSCSLAPSDVSDKEFEVVIKMPEVTLVDKLPKEITCQKELMAYMYRTQKTIHCKVNKGFKAEFNGIPVDFTELIKCPYQDSKIEEPLDLYISPPAFPAFPRLIFKVGDDSFSLDVERVPDERKDVVVLVAEKSWLKISFEVNCSMEAGTVSIALAYDKCIDAGDYVRALNVANNIRHGKYSFSYFKANPTYDSQPISEQHLKFWNKVADLEKILGVSFSPNIPLHVDDIKEFSELFCCFLDKKPFMTKIAPGPTVGLHVETCEPFRNEIGKELAISYQRTSKWDLLGASFSTVSHEFIFNAVVDDVQEEEPGKNQFFVHLTPSAKGDMCLSSIYYENEDAIERRRSEFSDNSEYIKFMEIAQPLKIETVQ